VVFGWYDASRAAPPQMLATSSVRSTSARIPVSSAALSKVPASGVAEDASPFVAAFGSLATAKSVRCIGPNPPEVLGSAPWSSHRDCR
jgi:hypothetical protein